MLSVGEILKKEREKQGIGLREVEKDIKIREKFLRAVEDNNWAFFSSKIYITGILKNYARFLKLDDMKILAFFRRDYERSEEVRFKEKVSSKYLTPETKKAVLLGFILSFFLFFGYFSYQLKLYFSPPKVELIEPTKETFRSDESIKVTGKTEKEAQITIFGNRIFQNKEGIFEYVFPLHKGKNELVVEVMGANGKKTTFRKIFFKER
ncbi:helix-turn-helix domain-containing protein [Candidatus Roizmanbacteria bacterium]|nr:helix-turn-helix domain-containing protein [Candidatus Roizmanbacteria bacterium]